MTVVRNFPRYSTKENIATNNVMLLLGRVYKTEPTLFEKFMISELELDDLQIGPSFNQQSGSGGDGTPDAMIFQPSFRFVVEAKLDDNIFWGKERYTSHFNNETTRILLTLSKKDLAPERKKEFDTAVKKYDNSTGKGGKTTHRHLTYMNLVSGLRKTIEATRTRFKIELDELVDDFESFLAETGLLNDEYLRMHVVPVGQTFELNLEEKLYYNQSALSYSGHKFIGLYYRKEIRHIGAPKVVLIPRRQEDQTLLYEFIKGEEHFTPERRASFEQFLNEFVESEGYGDDGGLRYHLVDEWHHTNFKKESYGGIMGPRHCYLPDYIEGVTPETDAAVVAKKLQGEIWDVG